MRTSYQFTLPRGYVDDHGTVHREGMMRLATARDELEPLRDPTIAGSDDPRLTVLVLARVVEQLGSLTLVTPHEIEGLFAADLAYLQDFYGVINFGTEAEFEEFIAAQAVADGEQPPPETASVGPTSEAVTNGTGAPPSSPGGNGGTGGSFRARRSAIEEIPGEIG